MPTPSPTDIRNAEYRAKVAREQNTAYREAALLALRILGPGFKPWMKLSLIPSDHRETGDTTPAAVVFKVYRGDERTSDNAMFIRKMPDGSFKKAASYEPLFGDLLTEAHPTKTMEIRGEQVPIGRYELVWSAIELYKPRDAEALAAARVVREKNKAERADRKFAEDHPLLAFAERAQEEEGRGRGARG